jgi:glycosyltransferase involved in cell wall biosynthesis
MKICLISTSFPRNKNDDAGIFIARLVEALAAQNISGSILVPHSQGAELQETFSKFLVQRVKYGIFSPGHLAYGSGIMPNLRANPWLFLQIPALLLCLTWQAVKNAKQSDLIHAHWLASAIPGLIASLLTKKPLVVTIRGEDLKLLNIPIFGTIIKQLLAKRSQLTTISQHFEQKLKSYFPNKPIHLIPNGVNRISKDLSILNNVQVKYGIAGLSYSVFAGRVIPLKRLEVLIELLAKLEDSSQHLIVCGSLDDSIYLKELKEHIESLNLTARVIFLGAISPEDFAVILLGAKLYWSASEYEGRPNSVLEALAHSVPAILSKIPGHTAIVTDADNGVIFEPEHLENTAKSVTLLLADATLHQNMGQRALESVSNLSWQGCASSYAELYRQVLNS